MATTTTISTQGHFRTVIDRLVAIATQGHFLQRYDPVSIYISVTMVADNRQLEISVDNRLADMNVDNRELVITH
jgi:hypothetical protein